MVREDVLRELEKFQASRISRHQSTRATWERVNGGEEAEYLGSSISVSLEPDGSWTWFVDHPPDREEEIPVRQTFDGTESTIEEAKLAAEEKARELE